MGLTEGVFVQVRPDGPHVKRSDTLDAARVGPLRVDPIRRAERQVRTRRVAQAQTWVRRFRGIPIWVALADAVQIPGILNFVRHTVETRPQVQRQLVIQGAKLIREIQREVFGVGGVNTVAVAGARRQRAVLHVDHLAEVRAFAVRVLEACPKSVGFVELVGVVQLSAGDVSGEEVPVVRYTFRMCRASLMKLIDASLQEGAGRKVVLVGEVLQVVGLNAVVIEVAPEVPHGIVLPPGLRIGQQTIRVEKERIG